MVLGGFGKRSLVFYINGFLTLLLVLVLYCMFFVQFKSDQISKYESYIVEKIDSLKDDIKIAEIEWTYLNRPERLQKLSAKHLASNKVIVMHQVKKPKVLTRFYVDNFHKNRDLALR